MKYRTLQEDLRVVKKVLFVNPKERPPFSFRINDLGLETCVIKVKIASKSFKRKGCKFGFRLIYAHFEQEERVILIELYHKSIKLRIRIGFIIISHKQRYLYILCLIN